MPHYTWLAEIFIPCKSCLLAVKRECFLTGKLKYKQTLTIKKYSADNFGTSGFTEYRGVSQTRRIETGRIFLTEHLLLQRNAYTYLLCHLETSLGLSYREILIIQRCSLFSSDQSKKKQSLKLNRFKARKSKSYSWRDHTYRHLGQSLQEWWDWLASRPLRGQLQHQKNWRVMPLRTSHRSSLHEHLEQANIACVAGAWKQWAQEKNGCPRRRHAGSVSLARARSLFRPLLPSYLMRKIRNA